MTDQKHRFATYENISSQRRKVKGIGGVKLPVLGIGTINVRTYNSQKWEMAVLQGVLHVPNLGRNIFLVWRAALLDIDTIHTKDGCRLVLNGETLIEGVMEGTMYKLHIVAEPLKIATACVANTFGVETQKAEKQSLEVWHHRLCHVHHAMVRKMASQHMVDGLEVTTDQHNFCEGCVLGKSKRHAFPMSTTCVRSIVAGQLVHIDVCGPMSTSTVGGCLYYVLFKDDFTRYTVTYGMKKKSEVFDCLKKYSKLITRETGNMIQVIRSDRGGEYTGKTIRDWLADNQVEQQHTVPYTP